MRDGVLVMWLLWAGSASAAWLTIKNDTTSTLLVQEVLTTAVGTQRSKPQKVAPGASAVEPILTKGKRTIVLYDPANPLQALFHGTVDCQGNTQLLIQFKPPAKGPATLELVPAPPPTAKATGKDQ
jgi:hypothetical protein